MNTDVKLLDKMSANWKQQCILKTWLIEAAILTD